ncbi:hypothetical protein JX265_002754 [Neoarthrinium moseri]|uniref:Uncharacterized protein n=1 Tax=Neoarthrinium moseri TaxID=1658444 RepID=A0A9Q0ATF0_9PEZI|nr:uncharacterized protein JN550_010152 [Neoarthrinium moseri]KAI1845162.1 hypothetical protein JX266_008709 [Neoarthrinium moseri]KAI1862627.1 hypothetical protein JN550_010152 [Neoarthrinium moseri]KAI1878577.1 hypothetical protein JX265_002754 [Neoarthrinium moseri]
MTTIAQNAAHRIGKWTDSRFNLPGRPNKPAPSPAPAPAQPAAGMQPPQHDIPTQGAAADYYADSQQAWHQYPPPSQPPPGGCPQSTPRTLELKPQGHSMVCMSDNGPLLTITFTSDSIGDNKAPHLIALRGNAAGQQVASAKFHRWTSNKTDLEMNGQTTKVRKEMKSATGMGKIKWERDGRKGMKMKADKEVIAKFGAVGSGKRNRGSGEFEILKDWVTTPQLEEIVVSCLVERERMRRDGELLEEGVWEIFLNSLGLPMPSC